MIPKSQAAMMSILSSMGIFTIICQALCWHMRSIALNFRIYQYYDKNFHENCERNLALIVYPRVLLIAEYHRRNHSKKLFFRYQLIFLLWYFLIRS